jgi:thiol-disulfide isomerase/thioredoxin
VPRASIIILAITFLLGSLAVSRSGAGPQDSEPKFEQAKSLIAHAKYEDAVKELKRLKKLQQTEDPTCDLLLAEAYEDLRAFKNAAESADDVLKAAGDDKSLAARAHNLKGLALMNLAAPENKKDKHLKEAEEEFRAALKLSTALRAAQYNLGLALLRQERDAEGVAELQAYLSHPTPGSNLESVRKIIAEPRRGREPFAPDFSLITLQGEYISSEDLRGKVVMLDFWGTWCPPCVESVPTVADIEKRYSAKPFQLISISSDENDDAWRSFVAKHKMTWAQCRDSSRRVISTFDVHSYPTYVLIDHEGIVRYRNSGFGGGTYSELGNAIQNALKAQGKWAKEHPDAGPGVGLAQAKAGPGPTAATAAIPSGASDTAGKAAAAPGEFPVPKEGAPATEAAASANPAAILGENFPQPARGSLSGNSYRNDYFGFTLHVLSDWRILDAAGMEAREAQEAAAALKKAQSLQQSLQNQSAETESPRIVTVAVPHIRHILFAAALVEAANGGSAPTLLIWAETPLPQVKTAEDYFQSPEFLGQPGAEVVRQPSPAALGGETFLRGDRKVSNGGGTIWTSELALLGKDYLWGFTITASSKEALDEALGLLRALVSAPTEQ